MGTACALARSATRFLGRLACRPCLVLAVAIGLGAAADTAAQTADPVQALTEGNRLFRDGRIEEAVEAYRAGFDPDAVHPTLVYNLGTALHHLDRLPEAILWYRRADASNDPWLEENLWLARRTLGSQTLPPSGPIGLLSGRANTLRLVAVLLAWAGLGALLLIERKAVAIGLLAVAAGVWGTAAVGARWGAHPAVLLADCATTAGDLPAGTEAWVRQGPDDRWRVVARSADAICPADAVRLVFPMER